MNDNGFPVTSLRHADIVLELTQDNTNKNIIISNATNNIIDLLHHNREELINQKLDFIIPANVMDDIMEDIDFNIKSQNLSYSMNKIRKLYLLNKKQDKIAVAPKLFPIISSDENKFKYEIKLSCREEIILQEVIYENDELLNQEHYFDIDFLTHAIDSIHNFNHKYYNLPTVFITLRIDNYNHLPQDSNKEYLRNIYTIMRKNLRKEDVLCHIDNNIFCIILVKCLQEHSMSVATRISKVLSREDNNINHSCSMILSDLPADNKEAIYSHIQNSMNKIVTQVNTIVKI